VPSLPSTTPINRLKETLQAAIYWKVEENTIQKYGKNFHKFQVNKKQKTKMVRYPQNL
jgi:hypothetical protein